MRAKTRKRLLILTVLVLVGVSLLTLSSTRAVSGDDAKASSRIAVSTGGTIEAALAVLPIGRGCLVTMRPDPNSAREIVRVEYRGKIVKATREGVALDVLEVRHHEQPQGPMARLPVISRLFRKIGIARPALNGKPTWIPVENIQSVHVEPLIVEGPPLSP